MELTKEFFENAINQLVSKKDLSEMEARIDDRFISMDTKFESKFHSIDAKFNAIDSKFDAMEAKFTEQIEGLARTIAITVSIPLQQHLEEYKHTSELQADVTQLKREFAIIKTALHLDV